MVGFIEKVTFQLRPQEVKERVMYEALWRRVCQEKEMTKTRKWDCICQVRRTRRPVKPQQNERESNRWWGQNSNWGEIVLDFTAHYKNFCLFFFILREMGSQGEFWKEKWHDLVYTVLKDLFVYHVDNRLKGYMGRSRETSLKGIAVSRWEIMTTLIIAVGCWEGGRYTLKVASTEFVKRLLWERRGATEEKLRDK